MIGIKTLDKGTSSEFEYDKTITPETFTEENKIIGLVPKLEDETK